MKKLFFIFAVILGVGFSQSSFAAWATFEIPGMMTMETSTGSNIGVFMASQVAIGNTQTAIGIPTIKTPGFVMEGKASNAINTIKIRGSNIGVFMASQVAIGNTQTAIGNASNAINTISID